MGNGLIVQWGYKKIGISAGAYTTVNFPISFSISPIISTALKTSVVDTKERQLFHIYNVTKSTFMCYGNSAAEFGVNWIAIGY